MICTFILSLHSLGEGEKIQKFKNFYYLKKIFEEEIDSEELKKITISNFLTKDKEFVMDRNYSIKISSIDSDLSLKILKIFFLKKLNKEHLRICNNEFHINNIHHSHDLSRQFELENFDENYQYSDEVMLNFITPTIFKIGSRISSIESLDYIFQNISVKLRKSSLWKEVNHFNSFDFSKIKIKEHFLSAKEIKSLGKEGFVGKINFKLEDYTEEELYVFNFLSEFCFFSGVGFMTENGYGQCERISLQKI